jgi:hypothetical protein
MNAPLFARGHGCNPNWLVVAEETSTYGVSPEPEDATDWTLVHARIVELGRARACHERELCRWLLAAERLAAHRRAGYASVAEYAERTVGLRPRQTEERLRVGRALRGLPLLDAALAAGDLSWSAVRELTRIAATSTEQSWLEWAKGRRLRQIEGAVATRRSGDSPAARPDPTLRKHVLRFEVRAETMALFRDLQSQTRAALGPEADDDALLYELARRALGGPADEGRASYQIAVSRCPDCATARIDAGGQSHAISAELAELAACDAQHLPSPHVGAPASPHVGATASPAPRRATQTIPPAIRREIIRRHAKRCAVPGCTHHQFLDVHHCDPRAEGGTHDPERLALLCGAHHRAVHDGTLVIEGAFTEGFNMKHADGSSYGALVAPAAIDVAQQVVGLLSSLGYKATQARARVDAVQRAGAPADVASFLRAALHVG